MNYTNWKIRSILSSLKQRQFPKPIDMAITLVALFMVAYQFIYVYKIMLTPYEHQNVHLFLALILIFLSILKAKPKLWPWILILVGLTVFCCGYVYLNYDELILRVGRPTNMDVIVAFLIVFVCWEACRRSYGWVLPIIVLLFIIYTFWGHKISGEFYHPEISYKRIATHISIGFSGVYGIALSASAEMIFYLMVFGGLLNASGATNFIMELAKLSGKKIRSGAAQTAVISSSLVGMVTGGPMANVGITGAFTIPTMKKAGYTPEQAGGIEAAASTGGQIMPPVMGATAFIMAEWMNIPYIKICAMAILPAILYYIGIAIYAHLHATKRNLYSEPEPVDKRALITGAPLFIVPISLLIILLIQDHSIKYSIFWTTICLIVLATLINRPSVSTWVKGFTTGALSGAGIAVACAVVGAMMSMIQLTGLEAKLPILIRDLSTNLPVLLVLSGLVAIILGTGLVSLVVYIIMALVLAPTLIQAGVRLEQAHFFLYIFAMASNITPPLAMAALAASGLAGASYFKTSFESFKAGIMIYVICFLIAYNIAFLGKFEAPFWGAISILAAILGLVAMMSAIIGQYFTILNPKERITLFVSSLGFFASAMIEDYYLEFFILGLTLLCFITIWQLRYKKTKVEVMETSYD